MVIYKHFGIVTQPSAKIKSCAVVSFSKTFLNVPNIAEIGYDRIVNEGVLIRLNVSSFAAGSDYLKICRRPSARLSWVLPRMALISL